MRASLEVADIFRAAGPAYRAAHAGHLSLDQLKVMSAIEHCRTAVMGGHVEACTDCGHWRVAYNSCRNRHCPRCQGAAARTWLAEREADLLPVGYFHVVFTLPAEVGDIALQNKAALYGLLFQAASETMTTIAADPKHLGARIGITAVLHSWGSAMTHHLHIHMVVPGGGLSPDGSRWISSRPAFLLPVRVLGKLFRRLFLTRLVALHEAGRLAFYGSIAQLADRRSFLRHLSPVRKKRWVVYAKPPFAGPETVLAYLSRYTHRVAISNSRLIRFDQTGVTFCYKDYRRGGADRQQVMTLTADEFIRRFLLHVLPPQPFQRCFASPDPWAAPPKGFHRIRHYGLLAGATRKVVLSHVRQLLGIAPPAATAAQAEPDDIRPPCPCCGGHMVVVETFERQHQRQPRATSSCPAIRSTGVVTRHGLTATHTAAPMLAEPKRPAPIASRAAAAPSRAGPAVPAQLPLPPEYGRPTSRLAVAPATPHAPGTGVNPKPHRSPQLPRGFGLPKLSYACRHPKLFRKPEMAAFEQRNEVSAPSLISGRNCCAPDCGHLAAVPASSENPTIFKTRQSTRMIEPG